MKYLLRISLMFFSLSGYTDQAEILSKGRDHYIDQAIEILKNYCSDFLPRRTLDSTYICRLQIKEDCSRASEKQHRACEALKRLEDLELKIYLSDKNLAQLEILPLYSSKPVNDKEERRLYRPLAIKRGSSVSLAPENPEVVDSMEMKINALEVRVDCDEDSDCKIQTFGKKICGGPIGTFVYSQRGEEYKTMQGEITKFNETDEAFMKKWNKGSLGTCHWNGRLEPAKCI